MPIITCNFNPNYFAHQQERLGCWFATYLMAIRSIKNQNIDYQQEKTKVKGESFYKTTIKQSGDPFTMGGSAYLVQACFDTYHINYNFKYYNINNIQEFIQNVSNSLNSKYPVIIAIEKPYPHYILCTSINPNGRDTEITYYDPEESNSSKAVKVVKLSKLSQQKISKINEYLYYK